ncbi:MAG: hypothetical protein ACPGCR_03615, partial [Acholeplasmataceae bacterium]
MKKLQAFAMKTMNGMTYGLFSTLIVGVIIDQIGKLLGLTFLTNPIYYTLSLLMGAGIGLGIGGFFAGFMLGAKAVEGVDNLFEDINYDAMKKAAIGFGDVLDGFDLASMGVISTLLAIE